MAHLALVARAAADLEHARRARLRPGHGQRLSGRVRRAAVELLALAQRARGQHVARLRPVGDAAAAGAGLRHARRARPAPPGLAAARRRAGRRRARARALGVRRAPAPARVGDHDARRHRQARGHPRLPRRRQDRHRLEGRGRRLLAEPLRRRVRRRRAGQQPAARGGGRHRRAERRQVLRRRRGRAGVLRRARRARCACSGCRRMPTGPEDAAARCRPAHRSRSDDARDRALARRAGLAAAQGAARRGHRGARRRRGDRPDARQPRGAPRRGLPRLPRPHAPWSRVRRARPSRPARARCSGNRPRASAAPQFPPTVLVVAVPGLSAQAGFIADRFFGAPSARLAVTGITGTNGKTTCAWLLAQRSAPAAAAAPTSARSAAGCPGRSSPARTPRPTRSRCTASSPSCATPARRPWRWRFPRTRSTSSAATACVSRSPCSPT